jgi:exonuclease SbcD
VRSQILAATDFKNLTIADLNEAMIGLSRAKLLEEAEALDPTLPAILVGHAHLLGARVGSERLLTMGADPMYDLGTFTLPNIDYVALGHIHKHQALAYGDPPIVYSGSIDRVDFGEEKEDKGWILVDVPEKGHAEWQFRKVDARPFVTIDAQVLGENATEDVVKAIARQADRLANAVVKLRIEVAPERLAELRDDDIRAQLKGAFYVAPVERNVQKRTRDRWGNLAEGIQQAQPIDALAHYLEQRKVDPERRDLLLAYARALIANDPHEHVVAPAAATDSPAATPVGQS